MFVKFAAAAATIAFGLAGTAAEASGVFTLSSSTFIDGKIMPKKVANNKANTPNNTNCVGDNVSPQLSWSNVPDGTKSLVLLMIDPEGRGGAGVNHWVAYGIAPSVISFAEGEVSKQTDKYVGGKSTQGVAFYSGPCTPPNQTPHHYTFVLIATDLEPSELPPGLTKEEVTAKLAPAPRESLGLSNSLSILGMNKVGMNKVGMNEVGMIGFGTNGLGMRERPHWR
jgi:Raf kinase inhibitor-like YbhB/YbcL family protein